MGQAHMHKYLERIEGQIDPSYVISHRITLEQASEMYKIWRDQKKTTSPDRD